MELEKITSPAFLRSLSIKELEQLAEEIREFILQQISKTGGHLSSNLGVVELTIALHYVFDCPKDKLIFDVGHQGYTHKILTGRAKGFDSLRQTNGMSGFLKYNESEYDCWEAGHSSTSISAAAGFILAKMNGADIGDVVSIIGDASIQNGLSFAGINYLATLKNQKPIIVLNDNNMSISPNVGGLTNILNKIRIKRSYQVIRGLVPNFILSLLRNVINAVRTFVYGNSFVTSLGYKYFGPIDGHNIKTLIRYFQYAKKSNKPILLHVKTIKGKGYEFAEKDEVGSWHGVGPFNLETGEMIKSDNGSKISWSNAIGEVILNEAKRNSLIQVITPAMVYGSGLLDFKKDLPDQLLDVGISEEHAVLMAGAMAMNGLKPVVSVYSTFLQRAYDQLNHDVARINAPVVFLIDRAGIVGADGSTHQGTFDVALLNHLPNFQICMPKNLEEAVSLIRYALYEANGPIAIRYPRGNVNKIQDGEFSSEKIIKGKMVVERPLSNINIMTYGPNVEMFAKELGKYSTEIGLINARFIKPLDIEMLKKLDNTTLIVYEEIISKGSLYASILEEVNNLNLSIKIKSYAIKDSFVHHGDVDEIKDELGLSINNILNEWMK